MRYFWVRYLVLCAFFVSFTGNSQAIDNTPAQNDASTQLADLLHSMTPLHNAASDDQIREYFQFSHVIEDYKAAWIAGTDRYRAHSQPYLPDSFWTDVKAEMQDTDLAPAFNTWFRHTVSSDLMDKVLDAYLKLGKRFPGSPMCIELGKAQSPMGDEWNRLTVLLTRQVIAKVYQADKAKIDEARARYAAEHPGWRER